ALKTPPRLRHLKMGGSYPMGVTIHFALRARTKSVDRAKQLVLQMRELALAIPFLRVGVLSHATGSRCPYVVEWVRLPWSESEIPVRADESILFEVNPGPGCETCLLGLCLFPTRIEQTYSPFLDKNLQKRVRGETQFNWTKWR